MSESEQKEQVKEEIEAEAHSEEQKDATPEEAKNDENQEDESLSSSSSSSSSSDEENEEEKLANDKYRNEDKNDLFYNGPKLRHLEQSSSDTENDRLEGNDSDSDTGDAVEESRSNFVVDEEGHGVITKSYKVAVSTNATSSLNIGSIETAARLFSETINVPQAPMPQLPELVEEADKEDVLSGEDFERECDRDIICGDVEISNEELLEEASFIAGKHFASRGVEEEDFDAIKNVLNELHNNKKTPQFIINYRKNLYYNTFLSDDDIYTIQKAIREYRIISGKRQNIAPFMKVLDNPEENDINPEAALKMKEFLNQAEEFGLDNAYEYYQMQINPEETQNTRIFKKKKSIYDEFIYTFLYTPDDFALKLASHDASFPDPPEPSIPGVTDIESSTKQHTAVIQHFYNLEYSDACNRMNSHPKRLDDMEEEMKSFASRCFAYHPLIISEVSKIFGEIVINTAPTERGMDNPLLYPMGKYGSVKRLIKKPVLSFNNSDKWLLIEEARESGYIYCTIDTKDGIDADVAKIVRKFCNQYSSDWDDIRKEIITRAVKDYIWKQIQVETEKELLKNASKYVCDEVEKRLLAYLTSPPFALISEGEPRILKTVPIICAHYSDENSDNVYFVRVSDTGSIEDNLVVSSHFFDCPRLTFQWDAYESELRKPSFTPKEKTSIKSQIAVLEFLRTNQTPLIAMTATSNRSPKILDKIRAIVERIQGYNPCIIFAPSDAARIYAYSNDCCESERRERSKDSVLDPNFLIAASTARRIQNPLSELTRLVTEKKNHLVDLSMTPFQSRFMGIRDNYNTVEEAVERACIKAVARIGVDMKLVLQSKHHQSTLQFVPGFGIKSAREIIRRINIGQVNVTSRKEFINSSKIFRKHTEIYKDNSLSFIRFPVDDLRSDADESMLFDGTLIPMDEYNTAKDFFKRGVHEANSFDHNDLIDFFKDPNRAEQINGAIDRYIKISNNDNRPLIEFIAQQLVEGPYERLRFPIVDREVPEPINEVRDPLRRFHEDRARIYTRPDNHYRVMSDREVFDALTISSTEDLIENSIIEVTIRRVDHDKVFAEHASGIEAIAYNQSGDQGKALLDNDIALFNGELKGTTQECVIKSINLPLLQIVVSFLPEDIQNARNYGKIFENDQYFDVRGEEDAIREKEEKSKNTIRKYSRRAIQHKDFKDYTLPQAEEELTNKPIGAHIFRPSSKGDDHLSLTIHFPNNKFANYDIVERGKRNPDVIGSELWIRDHKFSDLEEIKWSFVKGISKNLNNIIKHPKWIEDNEVCEEFIRNEEEKSPHTLIYRVTTSPHNGHLELIWQTDVGNNKAVHEPLKLEGDKIYYRDTEYNNIDEVILFLKKGGYQRAPELKPKLIVRMKTESEDLADRRRNAKNDHQAREFGRSRAPY